jgi:hypothetical protein
LVWAGQVTVLGCACDKSSALQNKIAEAKVIFPDPDKRFNLLSAPENPGRRLNNVCRKKWRRYPKSKKQCIIVNSHNIYTTLCVENSSKF